MHDTDVVTDQVTNAKERVEELSVLLVAANALDLSAGLSTSAEASD